MDVAKVNKWWGRAMQKHQLRTSHHPTPNVQRFSVVTRDQSTEPRSGRKRDRLLP